MFKDNLLFLVYEYHSEADPDTLKRTGASRGSSEKKGDARTLPTIFVNFTHENAKFSNKKQARRPPPFAPLHPPLPLALK